MEEPTRARKRPRRAKAASSATTAATAAAASLDIIKQEEEEPTVQSSRDRRQQQRQGKQGQAAAASVLVKKEEEPGEAPGVTMRASTAATAAAAAAAAGTMVTVRQLLCIPIQGFRSFNHIVPTKQNTKPIHTSRQSFDYLPTLAPAGLFVGCSGCSYKPWHASKIQPHNFYPFSSAAREFEHYASHFNSLEINYSFYRLPTPETCARWRARAPRPDFLYTIKAHRYFTHTKRINVDQWFRKKWEEAFWPRCLEVGRSIKFVSCVYGRAAGPVPWF